MSDKLPQPTDVLVARLRRAARALDGLATGDPHDRDPVVWRAFANTCLQAAGRLEELQVKQDMKYFEDATHDAEDVNG